MRYHGPRSPVTRPETRRGAPPARRFMVGVMLAVLVLATLPVPLGAETVTFAATPLPTGMADMSAVPDGQGGAYLAFGVGNADAVLHYRPGVGTTVLVEGVSPERRGASAARIGDTLYVLGGLAPADGFLDDILAIDLVEGGVTVVATLPKPVSGPAVAVHQGTIYAFGGRQALSGDLTDQYARDIVAFNPETGDVLTLATTLPAGSWIEPMAYAAEDGIYVVGTGSTTREILFFEPVAGSLDLVASLPVLRHSFALAPDGAGGAYIIGGWDGFANSRSIFHFDPAAETMIREITPGLPDGRHWAAAYRAHNGVFVLGGFDSAPVSRPSPTVFRFGNTPGNPQSPRADVDGDNDVDLRWSPPGDAAAYGDIIYEVERAAAGGDPVFVGATNGLTLHDADVPAGDYTYYLYATAAGLRGPPSTAEVTVVSTQDDAGSGGDASDDPARPTPLPPGDDITWRGRVVPVLDTIDAYGTTVAADTTTSLEFELAPAILHDIVLRVYNPAGELVATIDDGGLGETERVTITPSMNAGASGAFHVFGATHLDAGEWTVSVGLQDLPGVPDVFQSTEDGPDEEPEDYEGKRKCNPRC